MMNFENWSVLVCVSVKLTVNLERAEHASEQLITYKCVWSVTSVLKESKTLSTLSKTWLKYSQNFDLLKLGLW